jgi:hypothetical protein
MIHPAIVYWWRETTLHVHTAGDGKGYNMHVHIAGGVDGYTLQVHITGARGEYTEIYVELPKKST